MTQFVRGPSKEVHPSYVRNWEASYEGYISIHGNEFEAAAAFADAQWSNVAPPKPEAGVAVRIGKALGIAPNAVSEGDISTVEYWEEKAGRRASPDELAAVLAGPLLSRPAQKTIPGAGLPAEVAPEPMDPPESAPKKRGRPKGSKKAESPAEAPPVVTGNKKTDQEIEHQKRLKKATEPLLSAALGLALTLVEIPSFYRQNVIEIALARAKEMDAEAELRARLEGDVT